MATKAKVEAKVWASTAATLVVSVLIAGLNDVQTHPELLGSTPAWLQTLVIALVPTGATFLSGYMAKHTPRPDPTTPVAVSPAPEEAGK